MGIRSIFIQCVILSSVLVACSANQAGDKAGSSSRGESVSSTSIAGDAAATSTAVVSPPAAYLDSADVFDPDGYYFLHEDLKIEGRKIGWLELHTVDFYYGGELHYERPKLVQPAEVVLTISEPNSVNDSMYPCAATIITPDSLSVRCGATPVGEVTIDGHFLDKRGWYFNTLAYENKPTVLLIARIMVTKDDKVTHNGLHHFTFSSGD
ncbi:MAG: hypothetical protein ACJ8AC_15020 [Gemmatimonadaceae bacterium]